MHERRQILDLKENKATIEESAIQLDRKHKDELMDEYIDGIKMDRFWNKTEEQIKREINKLANNDDCSSAFLKLKRMFSFVDDDDKPGSIYQDLRKRYKNQGKRLNQDYVINYAELCNSLYEALEKKDPDEINRFLAQIHQLEKDKLIKSINLFKNQFKLSLKEQGILDKISNVLKSGKNNGQNKNLTPTCDGGHFIQELNQMKTNIIPKGLRLKLSEFGLKVVNKNDKYYLDASYVYPSDLEKNEVTKAREELQRELDELNNKLNLKRAMA